MLHQRLQYLLSILSLGISIDILRDYFSSVKQGDTADLVEGDRMRFLHYYYECVIPLISTIITMGFHSVIINTSAL